MNKHEWVEQEVETYPFPLPAHNKSILRSMKGQEFDEEEKSNADYRPEDEEMRSSEREDD